MEDFICVVKDKRINPFEKDRLVLKLSKDGMFFVKSSFDVLEVMETSGSHL